MSIARYKIVTLFSIDRFANFLIIIHCTVMYSKLRKYVKQRCAKALLFLCYIRTLILKGRGEFKQLQH